VATQGNTAWTINTAKTLDELLGPIDSASKAFMKVWARGYDVDCRRPWILPTNNGFAILSRGSVDHCPHVETKTLFVEIGGTICEPFAATVLTCSR